jgi:hypothetical protein
MGNQKSSFLASMRLSLALDLRLYCHEQKAARINPQNHKDISACLNKIGASAGRPPI